MLPFTVFDQALPYADFLTQFGTPSDRERWDRSRGAIILTPEQQKLLGSFTRQLQVLVLAGAWCGDCSGQCPAFERFAEVAPVLKVRYLDRDAHPAAQQELQINGGNRVPVVVFFSEDGYEISRYGTLKTWATELGLKDAAKLLDQTLQQEKKTDDTLSVLATSAVNLAAAA